MNGAGGGRLKRAVGITLAATFFVSTGIIAWGLAFTPPRQPLANEPEPIVIVPVAGTQPGTDSEGEVTLAPAAGGQTQPGAALPSSATGAAAGIPATNAASPPTAQPTSAPAAGGASQAASKPPAAATPVPQVCGTDGTCRQADIQGHDSTADCRSAINIDGTVNAYAISQSFLDSHKGSFKNITPHICGKVYSQNLKQKVDEHHDGSKHLGAVFQQWLNNFYLGPYQ